MIFISILFQGCSKNMLSLRYNNRQVAMGHHNHFTSGVNLGFKNPSKLGSYSELFFEKDSIRFSNLNIYRNLLYTSVGPKSSDYIEIAIPKPIKYNVKYCIADSIVNYIQFYRNQFTKRSFSAHGNSEDAMFYNNKLYPEKVEGWFEIKSTDSFRVYIVVLNLKIQRKVLKRGKTELETVYMKNEVQLSKNAREIKRKTGHIDLNVESYYTCLNIWKWQVKNTKYQYITRKKLCNRFK